VVALAFSPVVVVPVPVAEVPLDVPLLGELPLSMPLPLLPPRMALHADNPKASVSKPARSTLWCFSFMINSS
jgi:hypothetical protein